MCAAPNLEDIFNIGASILGSTKNPQNNTISIQTGDAVIKEVIGPKTQFWQQIGFASQPALAQPGKGSAQSICIARANGDICFATRDLRDQKIYGNLTAGETCIYASGPHNTGTSRSIYKDDGSIATITHLLQKGNSSSGLPILIQLSSENKINIAAADKAAISLDDSGIKFVTTGTINLGSTGAMALIGSTMALNAGSVTLGASASQSIALAPALQTWALAQQAFNVAVIAAIGLIKTMTPATLVSVAQSIVPPISVPLSPTVASQTVKAAA